MSTRCIVRVKGDFDGLVDIYHQHDGYPEGVGMDLYNTLTPIFNESKKQLKKGCKYAGVRFGHAINSILTIDDEYEITENIHIDIEYMYIVDVKKMKIDCFGGRYNEDDQFVIRKKYNLKKIKDKGGE